MPKIKATMPTRVRSKEGGTLQLTPGEVYDVDEDVAAHLDSTGRAEILDAGTYETQVLQNYETKEVGGGWIAAYDAAGDEVAKAQGKQALAEKLREE